MNEEFTFRVVFWLQLILIMIFNRILPALLAKKYGIRLSPDRQAIVNEGKLLFAFRVVAGIMVAVVIVIYTLFPAYNTRFRYPLPGSLRWTGVFVSSVSLLFWIYSQKVLDMNWSTNLKIQKQHRLVTSGPYRVMRHPIYTAMIFWSLGLAVFTANLLFAPIAVVAILWIPPRISKEEKMMIGQFGDEYLGYMRTTGKYLPKIRR